MSRARARLRFCGKPRIGKRGQRGGGRRDHPAAGSPVIIDWSEERKTEGKKKQRRKTRQERSRGERRTRDESVRAQYNRYAAVVRRCSYYREHVSFSFRNRVVVVVVVVFVVRPHRRRDKRLAGKPNRPIRASPPDDRVCTSVPRPAGQHVANHHRVRVPFSNSNHSSLPVLVGRFREGLVFICPASSDTHPPGERQFPVSNKHNNYFSAPRRAARP